MRTVFLEKVKRFPWLTNVTLYRCLFAGGDCAHRCFSRKDNIDWAHTRKVALVALDFHGNFNFFWMRALERLFPGTSAGTVLRKVLLDQTVAAPVVNSVFYTGLSFLDGKDDMFQDWREKFLNTYRTGLMYWPFVQFLNFVLVPPFLRTIFTGCCGFLWATFLCFSQQNGDGTVSVALAWFLGPQQIEQVPEDNEVK